MGGLTISVCRLGLGNGCVCIYYVAMDPRSRLMQGLDFLEVFRAMLVRI